MTLGARLVIVILINEEATLSQIPEARSSFDQLLCDPIVPLFPDDAPYSYANVMFIGPASHHPVRHHRLLPRRMEYLVLRYLIVPGGSSLVPVDLKIVLEEWKATEEDHPATRGNMVEG